MAGLTIKTTEGDAEMDKYLVTERLALTEDGRAVPEEHPDARWLYAIPGHEIPLAEAKRYGLVDDTEADHAPEPTNELEQHHHQAAESKPKPKPAAKPKPKPAAESKPKPKPKPAAKPKAS